MKLWKLQRKARLFFNKLRALGETKIFCIGCNKTGTTSLQKAFQNMGIPLGDQYNAEWLLQDWANRDFSNIIPYCRTAQVFQDVPFSLPDTFKAVDQAFPGSRFILTVRDSSEQWYSSLIRFHGKMWANGRVPPTKEDLQAATYLYKGYPWVANRLIFGTPEDDPYNKETLLALYENYNAEVLDYFKDRPKDLLVLNLSDPNGYQTFCDFIGETPQADDFPWENKTEDTAIR